MADMPRRTVTRHPPFFILPCRSEEEQARLRKWAADNERDVSGQLRWLLRDILAGNNTPVDDATGGASDASSPPSSKGPTHAG